MINLLRHHNDQLTSYAQVIDTLKHKINKNILIYLNLIKILNEPEPETRIIDVNLFFSSSDLVAFLLSYKKQLCKCLFEVVYVIALHRFSSRLHFSQHSPNDKSLKAS